jgi:uncharacterized protein DUF6893
MRKTKKVLWAISLLAVVAAVAANVPELRRYLRIRSM